MPGTPLVCNQTLVHFASSVNTNAVVKEKKKQTDEITDEIQRSETVTNGTTENLKVL